MKMKMNPSLMLTVTVAIGSFLQGWVYLLLIGYPSYMREELKLETEPVQGCLVWSVSSIGTTVAALILWKAWIRYRPLLIMTALLYVFSSNVMLWSEDFTLLLVSRMLDGFAWGFSYMSVTLYFMDTAPPGFLRLLLPQVASLCGVCICLMVDQLPPDDWHNWEFILDVHFGLSALYFILVVFWLPESPKWLLRKGRIDEAMHLLQNLRGRQDVSDEMCMLLYVLELEGAISIEDVDDEDLEYGSEDLSSDKQVILSTTSQQGIIVFHISYDVLDDDEKGKNLIPGGGEVYGGCASGG